MGPGKLQYDLPTGVTVEHRKSHTVALGVYCRFLPRSGVVVGFANGCRVGAGAVITDHEGAAGATGSAARILRFWLRREGHRHQHGTDEICRPPLLYHGHPASPFLLPKRLLIGALGHQGFITASSNCSWL